jgi:hypothetical protein
MNEIERAKIKNIINDPKLQEQLFRDAEQLEEQEKKRQEQGREKKGKKSQVIIPKEDEQMEEKKPEFIYLKRFDLKEEVKNLRSKLDTVLTSMARADFGSNKKERNALVKTEKLQKYISFLEDIDYNYLNNRDYQNELNDLIILGDDIQLLLSKISKKEFENFKK